MRFHIDECRTRTVRWAPCKGAQLHLRAKAVNPKQTLNAFRFVREVAFISALCVLSVGLLGCELPPALLDGGIAGADDADGGPADDADGGPADDADGGPGDVLCDANEHVVSNACVACDDGSTNAIGDNPNGADTICDPTLCGTNERVASHLCVACSAGSTNAAGDDATGADTLCDDACFTAIGVVCAALEQAYLKPSNTDARDNFGFAVALSGDTLAVGAPLEDSTATGVDGDQASNVAFLNSGAVYVFVRRGTTWSQQAYIKASNTDAGDEFGQSVSLSGDTLVVGAYEEGSAATGVGGDQASNAAPSSGAVYVFVRNGTTWSQQAYLKASNTNAGDQFGCVVALSGDTLVAGARYEDGAGGDQDSNSASASGAAYVFVRSGTTWSQQAYLKAANGLADDYFGSSLALSGDTLAVGAPDQADSGAVYVFARSGTTWSQQSYLKASNAERFDSFGTSLALSGDTLAVGAYDGSAATGVGGDESNNAATNSGAVYVFVRSGADWSQQAYLKASNTDASDFFGASVAIAGDLLAVGAPFEDSAARGVGGDQSNNAASKSGAVYLFVRSGTTWSQWAYLKASNAEEFDEFGGRVALSGDTLAVSAPFEDSAAIGVGGDEANGSASESGAVYVWRIAP